MRSLTFALLLLVPTIAQGRLAVAVESQLFLRPTIELEVFLWPDSPEDD